MNSLSNKLIRLLMSKATYKSQGFVFVLMLVILVAALIKNPTFFSAVGLWQDKHPIKPSDFRRSKQ